MSDFGAKDNQWRTRRQRCLRQTMAHTTINGAHGAKDIRAVGSFLPTAGAVRQEETPDATGILCHDGQLEAVFHFFFFAYFLFPEKESKPFLDF
ncbi:MAG: hypothetical protein A3J24_07960 [Deltaproteobacteria bacterium RIFCSPLOWO2_02_FULL_53_8]|nr:MAG: hypothetical protein A3J24_07960 [Deltaproteobacteria bacterium RIFCSPLOWO2_02_FULL_53_8]